MRARLIALLVFVSLIVSTVDFFASQWVFNHGFTSYVAKSGRDQVHDWAALLGLLYEDNGHSWTFLRHLGASSERKTALPADGLLYASVSFVVQFHGRVIFVHPASASVSGSWETAPIVAQGRQVGELRVRSFTPVQLQNLRNRIESSSMVILLLILFVAMLSATVIGVVFLRRFLKPLEQLGRAARAIAHREYAAALPVVMDHEVRDVAIAIESVRTDLARAQSAREKLLADLHHELRTPMTIIATRLEAIQCGLYPFDDQGAAIIYEEIMRMERLLADLRQLNDAQAGELRLEPQIVEVRPWLQGIVERFRVELDAKTIRMETSVSPPTLEVCMDVRRMTQVFLNLLSNALRFTPPQARISLTVIPHKEADAVVFSVCDEGPGIPARHLPHVLERFYRVDEARMRGTGGAGLGLAIVEEIVQAHGGRVEIESMVGYGTCVRVTLPNRLYNFKALS